MRMPSAIAVDLDSVIWLFQKDFGSLITSEHPGLRLASWDVERGDYFH